jgi:hypothetical protein
MTDQSTSTELVDTTSETHLATSGGGFMAAPRTFQDLKEMAKYMAKGELMVGHSIRGNPGDCMAVIMQAGRFGMDPFALSQKTYVVTDKGGNRKIAYEAQAVTSMIFASRAVEGRLRYKYEGQGSTRKVTVTGRVKGDSEDCEITTPPVGEIKVKNSPLWASDPDQQLAYYGSRAWARRHTPDVLMGVYDVEEFDTSNHYINVTPQKSEDPAAKLSASIERSSQERAEAEAAKAKEPAPADPEPQDAEFEEAKPAATEAEVVEAMREELEREPEPESAAPQGDLLGDEPATDANGAKLKAPAPEGQTSAAKAVEDALDAATSPEVKEPPTSVIPTAEGAEAYAQSWAIWYKSLTKAERGDLNIGGKFDKLMERAGSISDKAEQIISDAMNSPAADEGV